MKSPKILIADDDRQFIRAIARRLEDSGYEVIQAYDGRSAARLAQETIPDLLILDVHMPAGDGFFSVETMDQIPSLSCLPVIFVTGDKTEDTFCSAEIHGAMSVLHKPVDVQELLDTIRLLIGGPNPDSQKDDGVRKVA